MNSGTKYDFKYEKRHKLNFLWLLIPRKKPPIKTYKKALKSEKARITGHGDINSKEKINFDLYESDCGQKQYSIPLLTGPAKHFFWK